MIVVSFGTSFSHRLMPLKDNCLNKLNFCTWWTSILHVQPGYSLLFKANKAEMGFAPSSFIHNHHHHHPFSSLAIWGFADASRRCPFLWHPWKSTFIQKRTPSSFSSASFKCPAKDRVSLPVRPSQQQWTKHLTDTLTKALRWTTTTGLANCYYLCTKRVLLAFILEHHISFALSSE